MNEMVIFKAKTEFDVHVTLKIPEVGDKWEDARNVYTITGVHELFLSQCFGTQYYIVHMDVWGKDICNPDEPMTILMEYDPDLEVSEINEE